jgi:hypothetical protein
LIDLLCALRRVETESCLVNRRIGFPVSDDQSVLGRHADCLARDDIFAGNWLLADLDPKLPIDILIPKGQMLAFHSAYNPSADMLSLDNVTAERIVNIPEKKISSRHGHATMSINWSIELIPSICP